MSCYIASNDNRHYVALEQTYGSAAAVTADNRIPSLRLGIRETAVIPKRRDKTGTRTFPGVPSGIRKRVAWDLSTYMTHWPDPAAEPCYGPLFRAALGAPPVGFNGALVQGVSNDTQIVTPSAHGLQPGQAIRVGGEIRFVAAVVNATSFVVNAPFSEEPAAGAEIGPTISYKLAVDLPSATLFDFWSPESAVQRLVAGAAVDRMRIQVNSDLQQFDFQGPGASLVENVAFTPGQVGLDEFPSEPTVAPGVFPLVPGGIGQAWFGVEPARFHTLVDAELILDNDVDVRADEFGIDKVTCVAAGIRTVSLDMRLISNTSEATIGLYQAARQRAPIGVMFQLGQTPQHLCGVYMPQVVPEIPEFEDDETRLQWRFRGSRAQGVVEDELVIAFA
jgi:hypothetical protein